MGFLNFLKTIPIHIRDKLGCFGSELVVPIKLIYFNHRVVTGKIDRSDLESLPHGTLRDFIKDEWTRAKDIDEKLQKLTAALSVSVTISGLVGTTILQKLPSVFLKYVAGGLMFLATFYLIVGVLIGFTGFEPKPRYGYGAKFLNSSKGKSESAKRVLVDAAALFERDNTVRANRLYAAAASIRNGVVTFAVALLISSLAWTIAEMRKDESYLDHLPISRISIKYPPSLFN